MSTPFADDSLLPQAVPEMPVSPHGRGTVLRSERADWERRAAAAASAATELAAASKALAGAARTNVFGDCVEGEAFHARLVGAVGRLSEELTDHLEKARHLSAQCRSAADLIEASDDGGAASFGM